jgi:hypothetical protein
VILMHFLQDGPDPNLSWMLYAVLGLFGLVILVGALTGRGDHPPVESNQVANAPPARDRSSASPRKAPSKKRTKK